MSSNYNADSIKVKSFREGVTTNIGMYLNSNGKLGALQMFVETFLNVKDEHVNGYGDKCRVILSPDGKTLSVRDFGRGIPIDIHKDTGKPAIETILTSFHSGAKGNDGDSVYKATSGLRGCGSAITNLCSSNYKAVIYKDDGIYEIEFADGELVKPLEKIAESDGTTGTRIEFTPDFSIFNDIENFEIEDIREILKIHAILTPKMEIDLIQNGQGEDLSQPDGLKSLFESKILYEVNVDNEEEEMEILMSMGSGKEHSFFNGLPCTGIHLQGFKRNLTATFNKIGKELNILKGEESYSGNQYFNYVDLAINVWSTRKGLDYTGQTKSELVSPKEVGTSVGLVARESLEAFLKTGVGKKMLKDIVKLAKKQKSMAASIAKAREALTTGEIKKGMTLRMPDKVVMCTGKDYEINELILCEGK